jgi:monoamine oxidase
MDFNHSYIQTLLYATRFNIPTIELPGAQNEVVFARGKRLLIQHSVEPVWPFHLTTEEKNLGRAGLDDEYLAPLRKEVGNPIDPSWPDESLASYNSC